MSWARHRINEFNIVYTMYPEFQQQILDLTETLIQILDISDIDAQYLRELLHHLSITYNSIVIINRDANQYVSSSTESDWKSWLYNYNNWSPFQQWQQAKPIWLFNNILLRNSQTETKKAIKIPKLEFSLAVQKLSMIPDCQAAGLLNTKVKWHLWPPSPL